MGNTFQSSCQGWWLQISKFSGGEPSAMNGYIQDQAGNLFVLLQGGLEEKK